MKTPVHDSDLQIILDKLDQVMDPEIPVLNVRDLGIIRNLHWDEDHLVVTITPTYSGCPAMDVIATAIRLALTELGFEKIKIENQLSPAWTTDWMTESGKEKLRAYGIAPPHTKAQSCQPDRFAAEEAIQCPHCQSWHTRAISEFGSTACKALYQCEDCREVFDYFKCH